MNTFDHANETLRRDLIAYANALRTIVAALPQARKLCDQMLKEVRLAQALLAFASDPQTELATLLYTLTNLWPYRERPFARTFGFAEEIAEAIALRDEALRGVRLLARRSTQLAAEVSTCFANIAGLLEDEQRLLEECHASIRPHAENMGLTRKRLNLLIATVDARVPESLEQQLTLRAYREAAELLERWESGVPLDEEGVEILERCIEILHHAGVGAFAALAPARG
ncbi:MAG TPA: hypothetical protein VNL77_22755 [Roseiflexaceae bacterium]|nr:hypothetical protein [Roseiflexaceae bacterium]